MRPDDTVARTKGSAVYPQIARTIGKLGRDISLARRKRHISTEEFARQMGVSRMTLHRLEHGDPGVSLNTLSMAMFALGRLDAIMDLADPAKDDVGMMLTRREAPQRVRVKTGPRVPKQRHVAEPDEPAPDDNGYVGF